MDPGGIYYTSVTGLWQTVWLEPVPATSVRELDMTSDIDEGSLTLKVGTHGPKNGVAVKAVAMDQGGQVALAEGEPGEALTLSINKPHLWSPQDPFLYDLHVTLLKDGEIADRVESYFGMREIGLGKDAAGRTRITLNGEPYFMIGLLDQGYWSDGLYTPASDEALRYDVWFTKHLNFNMLRKHVKIGPRRWYYWCDKLGVLVMQDMPNGDNKTVGSRKQFDRELKRMIDQHDNHPSIISWVIFNEGWGQFDTKRLTKKVRRWDSTRLIDSASGWHDRNVGDIRDIHDYPGPSSPEPEKDRAAVLGEWGAFGVSIDGHMWEKARRPSTLPAIPWSSGSASKGGRMSSSNRPGSRHGRPISMPPGTEGHADMWRIEDKAAVGRSNHRRALQRRTFLLAITSVSCQRCQRIYPNALR